MRLLNYGVLLRRYWWLVLLISCLFGGLGGWYQLRQPPSYISSVVLYMSSGRADSVQVSQTTNLAIQRLTSYAQVVGTEALATELVRASEVSADPNAVANNMDAQLHKDTVLLTVNCRMPTRSDALAVAEELPGVMTALARRLDGTRDAGEFQVTFTLVDGPHVAQARSLIKVLSSIAFGLILGSGLGLAAAGLVGRFSRGVANAEELRNQARTSVLGILPANSSSEKDSAEEATLEGGELTRSALRRRNAIMRLTQNLHHLGTFRTLAVLGVNHDADVLARELAESLMAIGERVLLVGSDKDLPAAASGGARSTWSAVRSDSPSVPDTAEAPKASHEWRQWRTDIEDQARYTKVVIVAPPLLQTEDRAPLLAADAAILVARQYRTSREDVDSARQVLVAIGVSPVAAVLDDATERSMPRSQVAAGLALYEVADERVAGP